MKVLCIVSFITLNVFAEEVYRQKRDKSENSIDAEKDANGVSLAATNTMDCIVFPLTDIYMLGTASCYHGAASSRKQSAADNSSIIKEMKLFGGTATLITNMIPHPKYKYNPVIGVNNIAVIETTRRGRTSIQAQLPPYNCHTRPGLEVNVGKNPSTVKTWQAYKYPFVSAKVARLATCFPALPRGIILPNVFCIRMNGSYLDITLQGLPVIRNGQLRGILMNSVYSNGYTYSVYLAISPYRGWIVKQLKNTQFFTRPCQ